MNPNDKHTNFSCTKPMTYNYLDNFYETDFIKKQTAFFYKQPGYHDFKNAQKETFYAQETQHYIPYNKIEKYNAT